MWGIDIRDLWIEGSGLTPRKVLVRLSLLDDSSAYWAAKRGGAKFRGWTTERYTNYLTIDLLQYILYTLQKANGAKNVKKPDALPRPDNKKETAKKRGQGMFAAQALAALREQQRNQ